MSDIRHDEALSEPLRNASSEQQLNSSSRRQNRLGRSARRRKKKLQEILRAEEQARSGADSKGPVETRVLAVDRDYILPSVQRIRELNPWSPEETADLVAQLGYLPGNAIRISATSSQVPLLINNETKNVPVAIQLYPLVLRQAYAGGKSEGRPCKGRRRRPVATTDSNNTDQPEDSSQLLLEPFPTQFWLTHARLRAVISRLELEGWGPRLEQRLAASSPDLQRRMRRAHLEYAQERLELLTEEDWAMIQGRNWQSAFAETRGVAGTRNHAAVKCLHAHAAHYLSSGCRGSQDNVIGQWVMEAVDEQLRANTNTCYQ